VVDDDSPNRDLLAGIFEADYEVLQAEDGANALILAADEVPDIILLDVKMPGIDGYEVCRRLKADLPTMDIPVIFITSSGDVTAETRGLELGAVDYISKPINPTAVLARVRNQVKLREAKFRLTRLASTDALTGLANRRQFDEMLNYEYARHARSGSEMSLILLDIDHFKAFNDTYGHVVGDDCLRGVGQAIAETVVRSTDLAARYGGEEFVFLLPETGMQGALVLAEKIRTSICEMNLPHSRSSVAGYVTASLGSITTRCTPGGSARSMLMEADQQLYVAKSSGRNQVCAASAA
jgi:diguanylate cyclase (GGDEF)-like protein